MEPRLRFELRLYRYDGHVLATNTIPALEPQARIELAATFLPRRQSTIDLQRLDLEPLTGVEPVLSDYKTLVLPLDDSGLVAGIRIELIYLDL